MSSINQLFTEKYRPKNLDSLILPERVMKKFMNGVQQNMLFAGSPGTGKTSTAKALVNQYDLPYLYINASTDTSVDVIRTRITDFCSTMSILDDRDKFKVVILDEIDGVSDQFFKALRATMDQFNVNARFIATCNYINKVPDPIQSRFEMIDFDFSKDNLELCDTCDKPSDKCDCEGHDHKAEELAPTQANNEVELDEYSNSPDEEYFDADTQLNKMSGGLNGPKKQFKKEYPGDNPLAVDLQDKLAKMLSSM